MADWIDKLKLDRDIIQYYYNLGILGYLGIKEKKQYNRNVINNWRRSGKLPVVNVCCNCSQEGETYWHHPDIRYHDVVIAICKDCRGKLDKNREEYVIASEAFIYCGDIEKMERTSAIHKRFMDILNEYIEFMETEVDDTWFDRWLGIQKKLFRHERDRQDALKNYAWTELPR